MLLFLTPTTFAWLLFCITSVLADTEIINFDAFSSPSVAVDAPTWSVYVYLFNMQTFTIVRISGQSSILRLHSATFML